jgi:hypothetical protein
MSFGFGVGEFITVITLAKKIRKDFVGAPSQFGSASNVYVTKTEETSLLIYIFIESEASPLSSKMPN